jgi:hypothetical protein
LGTSEITFITNKSPSTRFTTCSDDLISEVIYCFEVVAAT